MNVKVQSLRTPRQTLILGQGWGKGFSINSNKDWSTKTVMSHELNDIEIHNQGQLIELLTRWGYYVHQQRFELGAVNSVFQTDSFELGGRVDQSKMNETLGLTHTDCDLIPELERLTEIINSLTEPERQVIYGIFAEQNKKPVNQLCNVIPKLLAKIIKR